MLSCRSLWAVVRDVPLPVQVCLFINAFPEKINLQFVASHSPQIAELKLPSIHDAWVCAFVSTLSPLLQDGEGLEDFLHSIERFCSLQTGFQNRSISLRWHSVLDYQRSESSYKVPGIDTALYGNILALSRGFRHFAVRHPIAEVIRYLPASVQTISFERIHNSIDLGELPGVRSLRLESDGRFLTQEGHFRHLCFQGLVQHQHLRHLILDGPWLQSMIGYSAGVIQYIKTIKGLETLVMDLDMIKHGPDVMYSVFLSLPNLRRIGRLGRVDKRFWRLFPKHGGRGIISVQVGTLKVPSTHLLDGNKNFFPDLAFGLLWAFPNLREVSIFVGFQGSDTDQLLDIVKQLKEGLPLVYKEYEPSIRADPMLRKLEKVELLQVSDCDLLQPARWNYVASKHGGGRPIVIHATDDASVGGSLGRSYKVFGTAV
ncbi:hypothetical protein HDU91_001227 [Kappamyces sp. JEL0680]|nr:hypothetical protein HDU91_001227 [Kappamyces sp. JEL0680]